MGPLIESLETNHSMPQDCKQADAGIKMASVPVWVTREAGSTGEHYFHVFPPSF